MKKKRSYLWKHFTITEAINKQCKCNVCGQILSYKSTLSNLKKHIIRRHPTINLQTNFNKVIEMPTNSMYLKMDTDEISNASNSSYNAEIEEHMYFRPVEENIDQHELEKALLGLFIYDFQPFSMIEERGFMNLIQALNPSIILPTKKTVSKILIPAEYDKCFKAVQHKLSSISSSVCITTDCWTSDYIFNNEETLIGVTCHFIDDDFESHAIHLDCGVIYEPPNSKNLAEEIKRITDEFNLTDKISAIITNNTPDLEKAVRTELKIQHFECFAHKLNSIMQDALELVNPLLDKIKSIVAYFKSNTSEMEKLLDAQTNYGYSNPKKLKQSVEIRWNSTYVMLERICELKDIVQMSDAHTNEKIPILSGQEWNICNELCIALKPFYDATDQIIEETYGTSSNITVLTNGLKSVCVKLQKKQFSEIVIDMVHRLEQKIETEFMNIELNEAIALSSLLDPRYKLLAFSNSSAAESIKQYAIGLMTTIKQDNIPSGEIYQTLKQEIKKEIIKNEDLTIWDDFDDNVSSKSFVLATGTETTEAAIEMERFLGAPYLTRSYNPLLWWKSNQHIYPTIAKLIKSKLNIPANCVPSERLFSKLAYNKNERKNQLKTKQLQKLLFLNVNSYLMK